eukprot:2549460-Rhodomonas_salina.5
MSVPQSVPYTRSSIANVSSTNAEQHRTRARDSIAHASTTAAQAGSRIAYGSTSPPSAKSTHSGCPRPLKAVRNTVLFPAGAPSRHPPCTCTWVSVRRFAAASYTGLVYPLTAYVSTTYSIRVRVAGYTAASYRGPIVTHMPPPLLLHPPQPAAAHRACFLPLFSRWRCRRRCRRRRCCCGCCGGGVVGAVGVCGGCQQQRASEQARASERERETESERQRARDRARESEPETTETERQRDRETEASRQRDRHREARRRTDTHDSVSPGQHIARRLLPDSA